VIALREGCAARERVALGVCLAFAVAACGTGREAGRRSNPRAPEAVAAASRQADELRRDFEEQAAAARNDLDAARRSAEAFLASHVAPTRRQTETARRKARRALALGERVLGDAAADGSRTAETWARVIQDRMMRLEETLNRLTGATGHADS